MKRNQRTRHSIAKQHEPADEPISKRPVGPPDDVVSVQITKHNRGGRGDNAGVQPCETPSRPIANDVIQNKDRRAKNDDGIGQIDVQGGPAGRDIDLKKYRCRGGERQRPH